MCGHQRQNQLWDTKALCDPQPVLCLPQHSGIHRVTVFAPSYPASTCSHSPEHDGGTAKAARRAGGCFYREQTEWKVYLWESGEEGSRVWMNGFSMTNNEAAQTRCDVTPRISKPASDTENPFAEGEDHVPPFCFYMANGKNYGKTKKKKKKKQ